MKKIFVKDIMIPLSDYATVTEDATLLDAIKALESEHKEFEGGPYRHQSVLVLDKKGKFIGKVSQVDIMMALEPNYRKVEDDITLERFGFSSAFVKSIQDEFGLWERPLEELYNDLDKIMVKKIMYTPVDHQHVNESDTLNIAMHHIVMGRHHSLLVLQKKNIVGILRSTDVFNTLYNMLKEIDPEL